MRRRAVPLEGSKNASFAYPLSSPSSQKPGGSICCALTFKEALVKYSVGLMLVVSCLGLVAIDSYSSGFVPSVLAQQAPPPIPLPPPPTCEQIKCPTPKAFEF